MSVTSVAKGESYGFSGWKCVLCCGKVEASQLNVGSCEEYGDLWLGTPDHETIFHLHCFIIRLSSSLHL
jgi:hypothetical protein